MFTNVYLNTKLLTQKQSNDVRELTSFGQMPSDYDIFWWRKSGSNNEEWTQIIVLVMESFYTSLGSQ